MSQLKAVDGMRIDSAQARELSILVELEARWENLRATAHAGAATQDLQLNQKAYEAFRAKLATYNQQYTPAHVPELLLKNSSRLGIWCRRMRDLYMLVQTDPQSPCPVHLLEKAHRCADRIGLRMNKVRVSQIQPATIQAAIRDLETLGQWCDDLSSVSRSNGHDPDANE